MKYNHIFAQTILINKSNMKWLYYFLLSKLIKKALKESSLRAEVDTLKKCDSLIILNLNNCWVVHNKLNELIKSKTEELCAMKQQS